jgi:hypothetical protein
LHSVIDLLRSIHLLLLFFRAGRLSGQGRRETQRYSFLDCSQLHLVHLVHSFVDNSHSSSWFFFFFLFSYWSLSIVAVTALVSHNNITRSDADANDDSSSSSSSPSTKFSRVATFTVVLLSISQSFRRSHSREQHNFRPASSPLRRLHRSMNRNQKNSHPDRSNLTFTSVGV